MVSLEDGPARPATISGSQALEEEPAATTTTRSSGHELLCAFQSQAHDRLRPVSSHFSEDLQQFAMFDSDRDDARLIGREYVVTEKIFSKLSDEEKNHWHAHDVEVRDDLLSSSGIQKTKLEEAMKKVANSYGRVFQSSPNNNMNALPPELSELVTSLTDAGQLSPESASDLKKRRVMFEEPEPQIGIPEADEGIKTVVEQERSDNHLPPNLLKTGAEDEYLNDAVHRPAVHHMPSHVPALTAGLPVNGPFLSETRSAKF